MPRDYSRNKNDRNSSRRDGREVRRNSSESTSGISWLLIGILVGLCIAGIAYLNETRKEMGMGSAINSQQQVAINQSTSSTAAKKVSKSSPQFDFYNMLPSAQVNTPTATDANENQTTSDSVNPASAPPNPARVNAILSGVTPPAANAIPTGTANTNAAPNTNTVASKSQNINSSQNNNPPITANNVDDNGDVVTVPQPASAKQSASATQSTTATQSTAAPAVTQQKTSQYMIQLAAFSHYQQADQFKAQLALSGYEANIVAFQKGGKTLQRVWLGPFPSLTAAAAVQRQLAGNQIKSTLLKAN